MQESGSPIRVLLVDDHPAMRDGLRSYVDGEDGMEVVGEAGNGIEAVDAFLRTRPDVTMMDLQMEGAGGLGAISAIRSHDPTAVIVVLTTFPGEARAARALALGAASYLLKSSSAATILHAIRESLEGRRMLSSAVSEGTGRALYENLTAREEQVITLVADGSTNLEIAATLGVSEQTIKTHIKSILAKLGARDRTQAVAVARRKGILDP